MIESDTCKDCPQRELCDLLIAGKTTLGVLSQTYTDDQIVSTLKCSKLKTRQKPMEEYVRTAYIHHVPDKQGKFTLPNDEIIGSTHIDGRWELLCVKARKGQ